MIDPNITAFFNEVYEETHKMLLVYLTGKCRNLSDVSDLCQEVYLEYFRILARRGVNYVRCPKAYLKRISKRKLHQYYNAREFTYETALSEEQNVEAVSKEEIEHFWERVTTSEEEILAEEIYIFLQSKPEDVQKIFYLYFELQQSIAQIAKSLSMKESSVKNKLYRTRNELRKQYLKEGADEKRR
ncbi:RNA polymerase sigma factor SigX [uncultured Roseburia sp.]|nr:RNA polymerase sigma factor SigX [uncultured Roseburia sp.]